MASEIEIFVQDVSDVEGHVFARYKSEGRESPDDEPLTMRGTLRGPYCERARTLPAKIAFHDLGPAQVGLAHAIVPDPCVWSAELPHVYQADVEAWQGDRLVAEYHGSIGLRGKAQKN